MYTGDISVVAPFALSGICLECGGQVRYEIHITSTSVLSQVNNLINQHQQTQFIGQWLLLVEWEDIPNIHNNSVSLFLCRITVDIYSVLQTNTFQGILVTDFERSYAVFTYYCEDLEFSSDSFVGFQVSDDFFYFHETSFTNNVLSIACLNVPDSPWVNIVYGTTASGKFIETFMMESACNEFWC